MNTMLLVVQPLSSVFITIYGINCV